MNKNIRVGWLLVLTFLFFSCLQEDRTTGNGTIRLKVATHAEPDNVLTRSSGEFVPAPEDFSVTISQEEETVGYWENYTDFPEAYSLPQGSYLLTAVYGDISEEGFDLPCFEGSEPFYLVKGETTEVEVTCFLANVKVTTEYTENFRNYFTSYETQVQSVSGNILIFPEGEERAAYIQPGKFTVAVRVTRSGGGGCNHAGGYYTRSLGARAL